FVPPLARRPASTPFPYTTLCRSQAAAEPGFRVGDDRRDPVRAVFALGVVDLVGAQQRLVDAAYDGGHAVGWVEALVGVHLPGEVDRKSTRLNSSHVKISYAVFCL